MGSRATEAVVLREHCDSDPVALDAGEREALRHIAPRLSISPVGGAEGWFVLNPRGFVGAIQLGARRFELRPKLPVRRLLFLLSYALDPDDWASLGFDFEEDADLFEAVIPAFAFQLEKALRHGPLLGYRPRAEALQTVRGRIDFAAQLRSRFGLMPPIECRFDEFTQDIEVNRLLKAAIERLARIRIRDPASRLRLRVLKGAFAEVASVAYDPTRVPAVRYDRLNRHFRRPVELARLILRSRSFDAGSGEVGGTSFLVDMAAAFEDFVVVALREALALSELEFPQGGTGKSVHLDARRTLRLKPDLSWWLGAECLFVGDVKYKRTPATSGVQHPDLYQLLAYTTATGLDHGTLVYAAGEDLERVHRIPGADKTIAVRTLDLDRDPAAVLTQVDDLAAHARAQAADSSLQAPSSLAF